MLYMTNREFFTAIVSVNVSDEITEFAKTALVKLDKKNENRRNSTSPNQKANEDFKVEILNYMNEDTSAIYTAKVLADKFGVSTQKISALVKQMVDNGKLAVIDKVKDSKGNKVKGYKVIVPDTEVADTDDDIE